MARCREEAALSESRAVQAEGDRAKLEQDLRVVKAECDAARRTNAELLARRDALEDELSKAARERDLAQEMAGRRLAKNREEATELLQMLQELERALAEERHDTAQAFEELQAQLQRHLAGVGVQEYLLLRNLEGELRRVVDDMNRALGDMASPVADFARRVKLANCSKGDGKDFALLNGVYFKTSHLSNGLPVYLKEGNDREALWYDSEDRSIGGWRVGPRDALGTTTGHASVMSDAISPERATAGKVLRKKAGLT